MAHIHALPDEVLLMILSYFTPVFEARAFTSLCQASKRLCIVAQPFLYNDFVQFGFSLFSDGNTRQPTPLMSLLYFTRTLISRPDLARNIRGVYLKGGEQLYTGCKGQEAIIDRDSIKVFSSGVQRFPLQYRAELLRAAVSAETSALMLLLVSYTPNAEVLDLGGIDQSLSRLQLLFRPLSQNGTGEKFLSNLKALRIGDSEKTRVMPMENLDYFLCLPRLERLDLVRCDSRFLVWPGFNLEPLSLNISRLGFVQCALNVSRMDKFVSACRCLKSFAVFNALGQGGGSPVEADEVVLLLSSQEENLECLCIELGVFDPCFGAQFMSLEEYPKICTLAGFRKLRHLRIEQALLENATGLPISLSHLTITFCEYPVFKMLESLVAESETELKSLRLVTLRPYSVPPIGMLGFPDISTLEDLRMDHAASSQLKIEGRRILEIVNGATFEMEVECENWDSFKMEFF